MSEFARLERRLAAVERALTESDRPVSDLPDHAAIANDIDRLDGRIDDLVARLAEVEGSAQALCGYVGNVRSVNEGVERRADSAVATVDRLERRVEELEGATAEPNAPTDMSGTDARTVSGSDAHTEFTLRRTRARRVTTALTHRRLEGSSPIDHRQVEAQLETLSSDDNGETRNSPAMPTTTVDEQSVDNSHSARADGTTLEDEGTGRDGTPFEEADNRPGEGTLLTTIRRVLS